MNLPYAFRYFSRIMKYLYFWLACRKNTINEPQLIKNIMVVSLDQVGDAILTSPLFSALKETFPNAEISVLCGLHAKDIYNCIPQVTGCVEFHANKFTAKNKRWSLRKRIAVLRHVMKAKEWNLVFNVRGSWELSLLYCLEWFSFFADIEVLQGKELWAKYMNKIASGLVQDDNLSIVKYRPIMILQAFQLFGMSYKGPVKINFNLPQVYKKQALKLVGETKIDLERPIISVHPCAAEKAKLWKEANWAAVCDHIANKAKINILLCGVPTDHKYLETIRQEMDRPAYNMAGKTDLMQLCGIISLSQFCLGLDSGPMHLSAALDVPALFLIGFDDPSTCAPISDKIEYIYHAEGDPKTRMMKITVDEVKNKLDAMLYL